MSLCCVRTSPFWCTSVKPDGDDMVLNHHPHSHVVTHDRPKAASSNLCPCTPHGTALAASAATMTATSLYCCAVFAMNAPLQRGDTHKKIVLHCQLWSALHQIATVLSLVKAYPLELHHLACLPLFGSEFPQNPRALQHRIKRRRIIYAAATRGGRRVAPRRVNGT